MLDERPHLGEEHAGAFSGAHRVGGAGIAQFFKTGGGAEGDGRSDLFRRPGGGGRGGEDRRSGQGRLAQIGEQVCAHDSTTPRADRLRFFLGGGGGELLQLARTQRGGEAALGLDALEELPSLAGQLVGQALDAPGTTGRVGRHRGAEFLGQHDVNIARDAAGETLAGAHAIESVIRRDVQRIHAAQNRRECLGGDAQHVHVGIETGFVPAGGHGMHRGVTGQSSIATQRDHDTGQERPPCAEFGRFHQELRAAAESEAQTGHRNLQGHAAIAQGAQGFHRGGESEGQLVHSGATCFGPETGVNTDGAERGGGLRGALGPGRQRIERSGQLNG